MSPRASIRVLLAAAFAATLLAQPAGAASLRARLHAALAGFTGPGTAALAVDLGTGRVVYAHNAQTALLPASNEKLVVTYAALEALGPAFRMQTSVLGEGRLGAAGVWTGEPGPERRRRPDPRPGRARPPRRGRPRAPASAA